ncbi:MAG: 50S ribosomal protein L21 [Candidatus Azambacteria bacterium]|nr:50S ribosomal protein L21 [Candidatus Azambacteria bacterium]
MFSIIETGGKQYVAEVGKKIKIEKLEVEEGKNVVFDKILLVASSDDDVKVGKPYVAGATVTAEVVQQGKGDKVISLRYKPKKRVRVKRGHRQLFTEVKITEIEGGK